MHIKHGRAATSAICGRTHYVGERERGRINGRRPSTLNNTHSGQFPASDDAFERSIPVVGPMPACSKGQLVHPVRLEDVSAIEIGRSVIQFSFGNIKGRTGGAEGA